MASDGNLVRSPGPVTHGCRSGPNAKARGSAEQGWKGGKPSTWTNAMGCVEAVGKVWLQEVAGSRPASRALESSRTSVLPLARFTLRRKRSADAFDQDPANFPFEHLHVRRFDHEAVDAKDAAVLHVLLGIVAG